MKLTLKIYLIFISTILFVNCNTAQKDTPKSVRDAFIKKYPGENDPDWHLDSNGNYESSFKIDGKSLRADFSPNGQWIETEESIKKDDLPTAVRMIIDENYKDWKISEIEAVDHHSKGKFYDIEFKQKGKNKDVEVNENGEVIN